MIVSTILLTKDNFYINENGDLPKRGSHDKRLLTELVRGQTISIKAAEMLPPSIKGLAQVISDKVEPTIGITIEEIAALSDILIVSHSTELIVRGKQFRLDGFELLVKDRKTSIYKRK